MEKLIRIDFDNIGDKIDYCLFNSEFENAQKISDIIKSSIKESLKYINENFKTSKILLIGADDILFSTINPTLGEIEKLKEFYFTKTGFTVSIGVGNNIKEAMSNLKEAKVSGKNLIIGL